ncbi:MAG: hypothetical protein U0842_19775 [Candidatus Binatia bacterium]
MRTFLLSMVAAFACAACGLADFAAKQQQDNRQMGMSAMNDMSGQTKLEPDATRDPSPTSASQDEQRRQYQENQDYQRALQAGQDREGTGPPAESDCVETSTISTGANSGSGTVTRNCRSRTSTP